MTTIRANWSFERKCSVINNVSTIGIVVIKKGAIIKTATEYRPCIQLIFKK